MKGTIQVFWNCDMGEDCVNRERPGLHEEHRDMEKCRGLVRTEVRLEPTPIKAKRARGRE
jgi:hypothetical protein